MMYLELNHFKKAREICGYVPNLCTYIYYLYEFNVNVFSKILCPLKINKYSSIISKAKIYMGIYFISIMSLSEIKLKIVIP